MGRKHAIIIYPSLKDYQSDLSKKWYVEYHWRVPGEKEPHRERIYKGLCEGSADIHFAKNDSVDKSKLILLLHNRTAFRFMFNDRKWTNCE
ncbi:hypothetical protein FACS1894180_1730 [Bacteroidia bacterium]|nr:hypothetical protein FACS1894180_1730 [Bacteroidia bacterium]